MYSFVSSPVTQLRNLPQQVSIMDYSVLGELSCKVPFKRFSIKYVISGEETYWVNGKQYNLQAGAYLMANQFAEGSVIISGVSPVKGLCIDIAPHLMSEAIASYLRPDTGFPDVNLDIFFNTSSFLENQYHAAQTKVGKVLNTLSAAYEKEPEKSRIIPDDIFLGVAQLVIEDHITVYKQLQQIPAIKQHTRKELYRRLQVAKSFMDEYYLSSPGIKQIALQGNLSEFHFFRLFKLVYGITPYNYMLSKRLSFAAELLQDPKISVSNVASLSGFTDVYTFSKAFKRKYQIPPSLFGK